MSSDSGERDYGTEEAEELVDVRDWGISTPVGSHPPRDLQTELGEVDLNDYDTPDGNAMFPLEAVNQPASEDQLVGANEAATLPPEPSVEAGESVDSSGQGPDDTPSARGSLVSSPRGSLAPSPASSRLSPTPSSQPFERRFQARLPSSSPLRAASPAFLSPHSRQSSVSSQLTHQSQPEADESSDEKQAPWEVVRWTKLKKMSAQVFSEAGKRTFGRPTHLTIAASIAVGTSKGIVLLFDYQQTLKAIIGQGTVAAECGSITSLAISADHSTVAAGHANGTVFTWDINRPAKPFLHISPVDRSQASGRKVDGHVTGSAVLHVGFLGMRHTALVSADDSGMAFSHIASRGLGAVARSVTTTRILGRYPEVLKTSVSVRKPTSVLAFAPLPLGNVEQATDNLGLTALLTPYLLVIVSTTPVAQTQYKTPRAKNIAAHSALTGSLAWFPAVKLRESSVSQPNSKTKLAFCWSNVLNVLEVDEIEDDGGNPTLNFRIRSRWKCDEAILTIQWLSRSVLALLTISQRLIILEDVSMRLADSSDLNQKHIYHIDLFSQQLQSLVDKIDQEDYSLHGVVPDAFHMSFKAYKGRLFLLGMNDVSMGTLSNWADRLVSLMEANNFIAAIELATLYYNGEGEKLTVGLPEDDTSRKSLVRPRLMEMISASLRYIFNDEELISTEQDLRGNYQALANVSFTACLSMKAMEFLFDEVYEWYSDASVQDIFLTTLEPYILNGSVVTIPPGVLKDLMNWYGSLGMGERLEEMICSLQTDSMDIDQVTSICKQYHLYDALIYVWNQALGDYITPLIDLMSLPPNADQSQRGHEDAALGSTDLERKTFPYMAFTLTGRSYPRGSEMGHYEATRAKASMYWFLFSSRSIRWPQPNGRLIRVHPEETTEPNYPYLLFLLEQDAFNFLSMLNEAFEDSFLNEGDEELTNGASFDPHDQLLDVSINRGRIIDILLEALSGRPSEPDNKVILDIFIARNIAKYPGTILLPDPLLRNILVELCQNVDPDLAEDCQLSVEYLLSVFQPIDLQELAPLFRKAGYFRVLKSIYRGSRQFAKWLEAHFEDEAHKYEVFDCLQDCLRPGTGLNKRQVGEVKLLIEQHAQELADMDVTKLATYVREYAPDLLEPLFGRLKEDSQNQYYYLKATLQESITNPDHSVTPPGTFYAAYIERYIQLMCQYEPQQVAQVTAMLKPGNLHLENVLPFMEDGGAVDAAIMLMAKDGLVRDAMERLKKHLRTLGTALSGLVKNALDSPESPITQETADQILDELHKYCKVGTWLCRSQSEREQRVKSPKKQRRVASSELSERDLSTEELLWLDLIDTVVSISREIGTSDTLPELRQEGNQDFNVAEVLNGVRLLVQGTFSILLASTAAVYDMHTKPDASATHDSALSSASTSGGVDHRFLRILRLFLARAARTTPSLSDLRKVLTDIFSAYAFEEKMITLAHDFIDEDVFVHVTEVDRKRRAGWRPRAQICERCKRRAWGTGAGRGIWQAWKTKSMEQDSRKTTLAVNSQKSPGDAADEDRKGKNRASEPTRASSSYADDDSDLPTPDSLVIFSCSHLFHKKCLEQALAEEAVPGKVARGSEEETYSCPLC